jgi:hypothetical protein
VAPTLTNVRIIGFHSSHGGVVLLFVAHLALVHFLSRTIAGIVQFLAGYRSGQKMYKRQMCKKTSVVVEFC